MKRKLINTLKYITTTLLIVILLYSCASIGRPEGGPRDETPPVLVGSNPDMNATNIEKSKIVLHFDEYIKLENASEKVVVSPPQLQQPIIKPAGKKINVTLQDSLIPNTTYTIDFGDAIVDNNEGNAMGFFTFTFSTGDVIDTMAVSGTVLESKNLEPIKNILVGLQANLNDSAFTSIPFTRVALTDSKGHFTIHGVAPGKYNIFGLADTDKDYKFSQKSEKIAFLDSLIIPSVESIIKNDTIWKDSLTIDTIISKNASKYMPDDIVLKAFNEVVYSQYLKKSERKKENVLTLYFSELADSVPSVKGINFDESTLVLDCKLPSDTIINYYVRDSSVFSKDSLYMQIEYLHTDTLNQLVNKTDTVLFYYKHKVEKPNKKSKTKTDEKEVENKEDSDDESVETPEVEHIVFDLKAESAFDIYETVDIAFTTPIDSFDFNKVKLQVKNDTIWEDVSEPQSINIERDVEDIKIYSLYYNWKPGSQYKITVDSAAIHDIYQLSNKEESKEFTVKKIEEYGSIEFNISGLGNQVAFIELLNTNDEVERTMDVVNNKCAFYYLNPGKYGARLIIDRNNNGIWDTGNYEQKLQPEEVYYYPNLVEFKANWDTNQDWDITATNLINQKPNDLKKQKPDEDKKKQQQGGSSNNNNRNRR